MAGRMDDKKVPRCSFCNKTQDQVRKLIAGPGAYICDECIGICSEIIMEEMDDSYDEDVADGICLMKPMEIKAFLDDYIIGQDDAKKALAVAVNVNEGIITSSPIVIPQIFAANSKACVHDVVIILCLALYLFLNHS